jgi:hypothetical protein
MPPVLEHGEVRVPVDPLVYVGVVIVGMMLGLVACFAMRPRQDREPPWRAARLPNKPQEAASREESNGKS